MNARRAACVVLALVLALAAHAVPRERVRDDAVGRSRNARSSAWTTRGDAAARNRYVGRFGAITRAAEPADESVGTETITLTSADGPTTTTDTPTIGKDQEREPANAADSPTIEEDQEQESTTQPVENPPPSQEDDDNAPEKLDSTTNTGQDKQESQQEDQNLVVGLSKGAIIAIVFAVVFLITAPITLCVLCCNVPCFEKLLGRRESMQGYVFGQRARSEDAGASIRLELDTRLSDCGSSVSPSWHEAARPARDRSRFWSGSSSS